MSSAGAGSVIPAPAVSARALRRLRQALERARLARLSLIGALERPGRPPADQVSHEFQRSLAAGARATLAEIDAALARVDEGGYGFCEMCGDPIGLARLAVVPHIRWCARCAPPPVS